MKIRPGEENFHISITDSLWRNTLQQVMLHVMLVLDQQLFEVNDSVNVNHLEGSFVCYLGYSFCCCLSAKA